MFFVTPSSRSSSLCVDFSIAATTSDVIYIIGTRGNSRVNFTHMWPIAHNPAGTVEQLTQFKAEVVGWQMERGKSDTEWRGAGWWCHNLRYLYHYPWQFDWSSCLMPPMTLQIQFQSRTSFHWSLDCGLCLIISHTFPGYLPGFPSA